MLTHPPVGNHARSGISMVAADFIDGDGSRQRALFCFAIGFVLLMVLDAVLDN